MAERLYYGDASLTRFHAVVTDIREQSRSAGQSKWQIALDRTAFYPTSGGQPHDTGVLRATAPSGAALEVSVADVEEDEAGEVWHLTTKPLSQGTPVEGTVDCQRRLDHMQQHSGQHLLSAVFLRDLGAATVSFHLGEDTSTIDLAADTLAPADLEGVQAEVNRITAECRPVRQQVVSTEEAQALLARGALRKLPPRSGDIRLIEIEGVEWNACGGTHVSNTGAIGAVLLRATERVRGGVRVTFVCGGRAVRAAAHDNGLLTHASGLLSAHRDELPAGIQRLQSELKTTQKDLGKLREELASFHAAAIIQEEPVRNNRRLLRRTFADKDTAYIKLLASRATAAASATVALFASTATSPATVVVAASQDLPLDCGALLKEALAGRGGRGGGSAYMAQGQVPAENLEETLNALASALSPAEV